VTRLKLKLNSVRLEIALILMQDRCMDFTKHTTGLKTFWMHPMELLGDVCLMESRFSRFGYNVSVGGR
jgi:hypothetical protein